MAAGGGSDVIDGTIAGSGGVAAPVTIEQTTAAASPKCPEDGAAEVPVLDDEAESTSEQLLKIKIEEDGKVKKYKKTLRLSTEAVVSHTLHLIELSFPYQPFHFSLRNN